MTTGLALPAATFAAAVECDLISVTYRVTGLVRRCLSGRVDWREQASHLCVKEACSVFILDQGNQGRLLRGEKPRAGIAIATPAA